MIQVSSRDQSFNFATRSLRASGRIFSHHDKAANVPISDMSSDLVFELETNHTSVPFISGTVPVVFYLRSSLDGQSSRAVMIGPKR